MPTWTDQVQAYAAIASFVLAAGSVLFVIKSLRQTAQALEAQNRSTDVGSVLTLFDRLDSHWLRFRSAVEKDVEFEFGQLISYYELGSGLFRDEVFQTKAAWTFYEHLHDVLSVMRQNNEFSTRFEALRSQPDNFENIEWLCSQPSRLGARKGGSSLTAGLKRLYGRESG